jgi:hypothetical protein
MTRVAALSALVAVLASVSLANAQARMSATPPESCSSCHLESGDDRLASPVKAFAADIHKAKGFGCVACHGGDPKESGMDAMDPRKGYIGAPNRQQVVQVCGRCHSDARFMKQYNPSLRVDQVAEFSTSVHGQRLREKNDPKVATCTSCHPAHSIKPRSDATSSVHPLRVAETCGRCHADQKLMAEYRIPTDQLANYRGSVHARAMTVKGDLSAPSCNGCHGNHGAAPPGISWVGNVCGQCHAVQGELFAKSVHAKAFTDMGLPGCAACHDNHGIQEAGDHLLGLGDKTVCKACHAATDAGGKTATVMRSLLDSLTADTDAAHALLTRAEHAGIEVSQAQFDLNGARDALVKARAAVHTFAPDRVKAEIDSGRTTAEKARLRGMRAVDELRFRRTGLAVSVVITLALIVALVLKIRQRDRLRAAQRTETT